jgi:bacterioferritin-associated ferredoxin
MYVCLCHGFTDGDVRSALKGGCRSVAAVYRHLADRPQCGKCVPEVRHMVNQHCRGAGDSACGGGAMPAAAVAQAETA